MVGVANNTSRNERSDRTPVTLLLSLFDAMVRLRIILYIHSALTLVNDFTVGWNSFDQTFDIWRLMNTFGSQGDASRMNAVLGSHSHLGSMEIAG